MRSGGYSEAYRLWSEGFLFFKIEANRKRNPRACPAEHLCLILFYKQRCSRSGGVRRFEFGLLNLRGYAARASPAA